MRDPLAEWPSNADAVAGGAVWQVRSAALPGMKGGLRALCRALELPGKNPLRDAHEALDVAVLAARGFSAKADLLTQLHDLNRDVAKTIDSGKTVTSPGVPPGYGNVRSLIFNDCIQPE